MGGCRGKQVGGVDGGWMAVDSSTSVGSYLEVAAVEPLMEKR